MVFKEAAQYGHVHMLQRRRDEGIYVNGRYNDVCIRTGRAQVSRWTDDGQSMLVDVSLAAKTGDLEFLRWIYSRSSGRLNVHIEKWDEADRLAGRNGDRTLIEWMRSRSDNAGSFVLYGAIKAGQLSIVKWICGQLEALIASCTFKIVDTNLEFINWMVENFKWPDANSRQNYLQASLKRAAALGLLDVIEAYVDGNFFSGVST